MTIDSTGTGPRGQQMTTSRQQYNARRRIDKPWRALYLTKRWRQLRAHQLKMHPRCWLCAQRGVATRATVCNHMIRHNGDPALFWSGPFNSLCKDCHDVDQQRIEKGGRARARVDDDGWPSDIA